MRKLLILAALLVCAGLGRRLQPPNERFQISIGTAKRPTAVKVNSVKVLAKLMLTQNLAAAFAPVQLAMRSPTRATPRFSVFGRGTPRQSPVLMSADELRLSKDGTGAFTMQEFKDFYGDSWQKEWESAKIASDMKASDLLKLDEEARIDSKTGGAFTMQEFKDYYGEGWEQEWAAARPASDKDEDSARPAAAEEVAEVNSWGLNIQEDNKEIVDIDQRSLIDEITQTSKTMKMMESMGALGAVWDRVGNQKTSYNTYYMNLKHRLDRRKRLEYQLEHHGMSFTRLEARTSKTTDDSVIDRVWHTGFNAKFDLRQQPGFWHKIGDGERGCAGSHAALWIQCVLDNRPMLLLEDDVLLGPLDAPFSATVDRLVEFMEGHDPTFLHLQTNVKVYGDYEGSVTPSMKVRAARYSWQTSGYIIWPETAVILLKNLPMHEPVDNYLSRLAYNGEFRMYACDPAVILQYSATDGDIPHTGVEQWSLLKEQT